MQHENSFSVSRFKNRNGVFSFRVDGYLNGNRIRRNFKTREEAAAEQAALTIKALQLASNLRSVSTSLTEDQVTTITSLAGVQEFPMRVKCATMAWHTLLSAVEKK